MGGGCEGGDGFAEQRVSVGRQVFGHALDGVAEVFADEAGGYGDSDGEVAEAFEETMGFRLVFIDFSLAYFFAKEIEALFWGEEAQVEVLVQAQKPEAWCGGW